MEKNVKSVPIKESMSTLMTEFAETLSFFAARFKAASGGVMTVPVERMPVAKLPIVNEVKRTDRPKKYKADGKWMSQSITAEAYKTVFGCEDIPSVRVSGTHIAPNMREIKNKAGTWIGTLTANKERMGSWDTLRIKINSIDPEKLKQISTRPMWRKREKKGLSMNVLKCWYFVRVSNAQRKTRKFLNRKDLEKFGVRYLPGNVYKKVVVFDESAFREGLYKHYGITRLPGDKGWMKNELGARLAAEIAEEDD